jgi:hypothetical protein
MKFTAFASCGALALVLAACAAPNSENKVVLAPLPCVWPGTTQAAPGWTCDQPVEGLEISAVGIYEKTAAGLQFQKDQATAAARVALARNMRTRVNSMIKQYAETTGAANAETVDRVNTSVSKLITNEVLDGTRVYQSVVSPAGTMYVLVGLDAKLAARKTEDVIKTSMSNDRAAWQQFKAKQAQDELAAEIAAQPSKP